MLFVETFKIITNTGGGYCQERCNSILLPNKNA